MASTSIWINGSTRSGKTTRLIEQFCQWTQEAKQTKKGSYSSTRKVAGRSQQKVANILVFAANDDNRRDLADRLAIAVEGKYPIISKTPLGFFQDEVMLFWPLLIRRLNLRAQFPLRLRPETEQELATQLWRSELDRGNLRGIDVSEYRLVRRILDLLQLAAVSGTSIEQIPAILEQGFLGEVSQELEESINWATVGQLLLNWRQWCLERGLLTYGIICDLYWQYLLTDPVYQQHLKQRYQAVIADDVDDYPAIAADLFSQLLDWGAVGAFTYNPDGAIRLGLNADPNYLETQLSSRCRIENLVWRPIICLEESLGEEVVQMIDDPASISQLPSAIQSIQTTSRAQLLRQTAEVIVDAVRSGQVKPEEIAVIAPGLDAIARYTLIEILTSRGIAVQSLNDQRPLNGSPMIRALLTLLVLIYPGLGRLVDKNAIAEMLVVLSQEAQSIAPLQDAQDDLDSSFVIHPSSFQIDPVRAGLIADHCYRPDLEQPQLLPVTEFPRWDRLGHRATSAYEKILKWVEGQRSQQEQRLIPSCVALLDRAIQEFLWNGSNLPYDQLAALRELMETAQHYWEVDARLRHSEQIDTPSHTTIGRFIQLLRQGTITANPYPVRRIGATNHAVTLATIFQYRAARRSHRWHFWLDAGSPLWSKGGAATLFGAPLFLKEWSGERWTEEDILNADEQRLRRILRDLLARVAERVYLCHSDLATNGQEQDGALIHLVNASLPLNLEAVSLAVP